MADPGSVKSIAEHWDLLWWLLVVGVGAALAELRYAFHNMCKENKEFLRLHNECQRELPEKFVSNKIFEKWCASREELWGAINYHRHAEDGGVIRTPKMSKP